jgi:gamma-D-glutamyl-L-lysine dipeptidyl-peptidase
MVDFCYIKDSVVDMREHPSIQSKVVSQAIFSEKIEIDKTKDDWSYIFTPDGYAGWIPFHSFVVRDKRYEANVQVSRLAAHLYGLKDIEYGPMQTIPYGSRLQTLDYNDGRWIKVLLPSSKEGYIQKGDVVPQQIPQSKIDLVPLSQRFLGLPYTWGGRSSFGYDCSGFVQMLYQQAVDTRFQTIELNFLKPGDLIFFGNANRQVKHVGMFLEKDSFIHATSRENQPWIRISHLSDFEWSGHADATYPYRLGRAWRVINV